MFAYNKKKDLITFGEKFFPVSVTLLSIDIMCVTMINVCGTLVLMKASAKDGM